jgi:hypothetical protein
MNPSTQRTDLSSNPTQETGAAADGTEPTRIESGFDPVQWRESGAEREFHGAGGRSVLAAALVLLSVLWIGYTAWSAGHALAGEPFSSPALAQWVAIAAGPLALFGLAWIMFGRTRRKEAERFTRSVIAMRAETRSLEALLQVLSQRINDSRSELTMIAQHLMELGDQATGKLGGITREFDSSSSLLARHGEALDRAAQSARTDIAVVLEDLPQAEATARSMAEQLREAGTQAVSRAADFEQQVGSLSNRAREAEETVAGAAQRLVTHLTHIESAGAAAAVRVGEAESSMSATVDALLGATAETLDRIRSGIDTQAAAVVSLVEQASAGIGRTGSDAAEALGTNVASANVALDGLTTRLAEQERSSQRIVAETARALGELDSHFSALAEQGDQRAASFVSAVGRARSEIQALGLEAGEQDGAIDGLASRTAALRQSVDLLAAEVREQLGTALDDAESGASRLLSSAQAARPEIDWMREAAVEASDRIAAGVAGIDEQQDRFAALLSSIDDGVGTAGSQLGALAGTIADAQAEAARLSSETGPALVAAMLQVREAAGHAAERAREALASVVPETAEQLSEATREALERTMRDAVEDRLREVDSVAAHAVEAARAASDRLTQQMLTLGQSAAALEQHIERTNAEQRERDSEAFARRVSLLIDSMHSASIDVGKILSDEVDEKAWESYLKGNRGVFTRRAVRLLDGEQAKAIRAHYEADPEFQQSVNRYVHDFEAMLRRVLAEREGGMLAVTLMSSDMGKLYAALAEAIERRR